ncbi:transcriptional regulator with XRE-family HTH domain [Bradyrhizobium japonicum]
MASTEDLLSHFCKNVRHLASVHRLKQVALAKDLGWDRTVLAKLMSGEREPNTNQKGALALYFRIEPSELDLDHGAFLARHTGAAVSNLPLMTFRAVRQNTNKWRECFEKYRGQYVLHYLHSEPDTVISSLLSIDRLTGDGLHASLVNPHKDSGGNMSYYEYEGYAYPVREYMYFLLEQKNSDYEILSLILHEARTPSVHLLKGMISGIGVVNEVSYIAARPLVALKRKRPIDDWAQSKEIGYRPRNAIDNAAQLQLSSEKITVTT